MLACIELALQEKVMKIETNRGKAIADLVPSRGVKEKDKVAAAEKLKAFMRADPVRGADIRALIEEGRV